MAIEYHEYLYFLLSKPNYFIQFEMGYPVDEYHLHRSCCTGKILLNDVF